MKQIGDTLILLNYNFIDSDGNLIPIENIFAMFSHIKVFVM